MKNLPLSIQIWLVFAIITLFISILLSIILPMTLRDFFTKEIYTNIENAQGLMFNRFDRQPFSDFQAIEDIRTVNHFIIYNENQIVLSSSLPISFLNEVKKEASIQKNISQRYSGKVNNEKIFYVITKGKSLNQDINLVSYVWDSYREDLVQTLFKKLAIIMTIVFLLSWIPAIGLSKYLSSPLVSLEKRVEKLANHEWNEPVELKRGDEIGRLGESIEQLRNQLIYQDEMQQSFLQHISHELKTPVMVIRSYSQAIRDGIYPKGDLDCSVEIIDKEAERLEKHIRNLLYLTKLDYLSNHELSKKVFSLDKLIMDVVERLSWNRTELDWNLDLLPTDINGDTEQWRIVIENLLDNQIRYANSQISISLKPNDNNKVLLTFWNDGPSIEPEIIDSLFNKFDKGYKGEFGLGLAIVHRIVTLHEAKIWAENKNKGVSFYVEIPAYSVQ
ncbi:MAG: HAMP domain-containing histidine kinase [Tissierellia bacterium]|nr:HAMP domain-containing histidine kinase [Tissierellia bacterium]